MLTLVAGAGAPAAADQGRLLGGAALGRGPGACAPPPRRWAGLGPGRGQGAEIGRALAALRALEGLQIELVVVADRCTDATAQLARAAGASVLERTDGPPGKGAALAWALERVLAESRPPDAIAVVDADCRATP